MALNHSMNYSHWKIGGQMPLPRAGCAVGAVNNHVIVAGGGTITFTQAKHSNLL